MSYWSPPVNEAINKDVASGMNKVPKGQQLYNIELKYKNSVVYGDVH